jgi:DnaJ like chaperone protein
MLIPMTIWTRIADYLSSLSTGESLAAIFDRLRTPPERTVAFTIAVIALAAKMAKADGQVTRDEVAAFREIFTIAPEDEANAARVYNLAREDVAGFEAYARRIANMFSDRHATLFNLMEGLFHIATADSRYHEAEDIFLAEIGRIFGLSEREFRALRTRYVPDAPPDPHAVLGVGPEAHIDEIRAAWKRIVRDCHPDRMVARGVPEEARKLAEERLVAANRAWEEIEKAHAL